MLFDVILYDPGPIDVWGRILSYLFTLDEKKIEFLLFLFAILAVVGLCYSVGEVFYLDSI